MKLCKFSGELCDEAVRVDRGGDVPPWNQLIVCRVTRTLIKEITECPKGKKKAWKEEGHGDM